MTILNLLHSFSGALKPFGEMLKNHQIFSNCATPCMFSAEKKIEMVILHHQSKICTRKCKNVEK